MSPTIETIGEVTELVIEVNELAYHALAEVDAPESDTRIDVLELIAEVEELDAEAILEF